MIRPAFLALALTFAVPGVVQAQLYDSGWSRVAAGDLEQLDLNGGGVRINNFLVHADQTAGRRDAPAHSLRTFVFSASTTRQDSGAREVFIQLVGVRENGSPTLSTSSRTSFSASGGRRAQQSENRTPASEAEVAETRNYFVRVIVR